LKHVAKRLTYANVMSTIAVFLVLGGATAVAASTIGKNSVGSKQLKNNAVTTAKLKNGAVTGPKLENGSVTGAKINLSSLGTVPSATNANHATTADNATNAANATNATHATTAASSEQIKTWFTTASLGQTVTLLTIGPFTYTGECKEEGGGPYAQTWVETSQANSIADSYAEEEGYESGEEQNPWNPGHRVTVGYSSQEHAADGHPGWTGPYDGSDTQLSGDGHTYVNTFAAVGTQALGADCVFAGHAVVVTR